MGSTETFDFPFPDSGPGVPNDVPGDIQALAEAVDTGLPSAIAQGASYAVDPLLRWHDKLRAGLNPKLSFIGDSTSLRANTQLHANVFAYHVANPGGALTGLTMATSAGILGGGNNGATADAFFALRGGAITRDAAVYSWEAMVDDQADLVVMSFGLNNFRPGGETVNRFVGVMRAIIEAYQEDCPGKDLLLRMPNIMVGTPNAYITPATTAAAQTYSSQMREAYLRLEGEYPHVGVADVQSNVFGLISHDTHPLMGDQLHPNGAGILSIIEYLVRAHIALPESRFARVPWTEPGTTVIGPPSSVGPTNGLTRYVRQIKVQGGGNGYFDFEASPAGTDLKAGEYAVSPADTIYFAGRNAPVSLAAASNISQHTPDVKRVFMAGDWSSLAGLYGVVIGNHYGEGVQGGRREVVIPDATMANVAAGATLTITVAVTGATGWTGIIAAPSYGDDLGGLLIVSARCSGPDEGKFTFWNPTGAAINRGDTRLYYWLAR